MQLRNASKELFNQLIHLLTQLDSSSFAKPVPLLSNASIGKHIRHIIEFYDLLLHAYHSGKINYDLRKHDIQLEQSKELATNKITYLSATLEALAADKPLLLYVSYDRSGTENMPLSTSYFRELHYNLEHAIHHMAIIRMALKQEFPAIVLPDTFGIAYATLRFQVAAK